MANKLLQKSSKTSKYFAYSKGSVSLDFSLNIDDTKELEDFKAILTEAQADVNDVLKGLKN